MPAPHGPRRDPAGSAGHGCSRASLRPGGTSASALRRKRGEFHRIMEYSELEGTYQDRRVQLLALCRTPQEAHHVPESVISKRFLDSDKLGAVATSLGIRSVLNHTLREKVQINLVAELA